MIRSYEGSALQNKVNLDDPSDFETFSELKVDCIDTIEALFSWLEVDQIYQADLADLG